MERITSRILKLGIGFELKYFSYNQSIVQNEKSNIQLPEIMIDQSDDEGKQIIFVNDLTNVVFAEYKRHCPEGFILHCLIKT